MPLQRYALLVLATYSATMAATLADLTTFRGTYPFGDRCGVPPSVPVFTSTDTSVNTYFMLNDLTPADTVRVQWTHQPTGAYWWRNQSPVSRIDNWCSYWPTLFITDISPRWGQWKVQVIVNNITLGEKLFTINLETPRGQQEFHEGFFDPIHPGCSHFAGWARDGNDLTATLSVDIEVDGFPPLRGIRADVDRGGTVGRHGWNKYDLQLYEDGSNPMVSVFYSGTRKHLGGSPQRFPPPDAQPGCFPPKPSSLTISWVASFAPPQTIMTGQTATVQWQVSGASQIQSRLCYGTSSDSATLCQQTATYWQYTGTNTSGTHTDFITALSQTTSQTLYAVVQAQAGGLTAYTPLALMTIIRPPPANTETGELRVYSGDLQYSIGAPIHTNLSDFIFLLHKRQLSQGSSRYSYSIIAFSTARNTGRWTPIINAHATMVIRENIDAFPDSFTIARRTHPSGPLALFREVVGGTDNLALWEYDQAPTGDAGLLDDAVGITANLIQTLVRAKYPASYTLTALEALKQFSDFFASRHALEIGPKSNIRQALARPNEFDVYTLTPHIDRFGDNAIRFFFIVDESNGQPQFFLRVQNNQGVMVSLEIDSDRSLLYADRRP